MQTGPILLGMTLVSLYMVLWLGLPMILTDWHRRRRARTMQRQIALTDAIDAEFGTMVAPQVEKPLRGPWQVRIAVPFGRPAVTAGILAATHRVFPADEQYQVILTPTPDLTPEDARVRVGQATGRCSREALTA